MLKKQSYVIQPWAAKLDSDMLTGQYDAIIPLHDKTVLKDSLLVVYQPRAEQ